MRWFEKRRRVSVTLLMAAVILIVAWGLEKTELQKRFEEVRRIYGPYAVARIQAALKLIEHIKPLSDKEKLEEVNRFVNKVRFVTDLQAWGKKDYWAKPVEFLGRDKGDCEDFVITKYAMLRKAGVAEEKLYFTYVKALKLNQAHMVLTYYETPKSIPLVLDNLNHRVLPATKRRDLAYVFSFNAKALYLNRQQALGRAAPGVLKRNRKWVDFLESIEKDLL